MPLKGSLVVLLPMCPVRTQKRWSREWELNPRPADYESAALPLSYLGPILGSDSNTSCCAFSVDRPFRI